MTTKTKLIRSIYLYLAALISLIFVAVGTGTLVNTGLKYYVFPKAEKGGYNQCNQSPQIYALDKNVSAGIATEDQKVQLENMLADYNKWKTENTGEECYSALRQSAVVNALTMIFIALPIFLFHWMIIRREKDEKDESEV